MAVSLVATKEIITSDGVTISFTGDRLGLRDGYGIYIR